jgi:CBS domain containing-hemolysin-like protein
MKHKEKLAGAACGVISFLTAFLRPVIWFLTVSTNGVLRLLRINPNEKEEAVSEEDIVIMLDAGAEEGTLKQDDVEYIKNVFRLEHLTAADVMTPAALLRLFRLSCLRKRSFASSRRRAIPVCPCTRLILIRSWASCTPVNI